ncbi:MAG: hypothetical protein AB1488_10385, partial [Nitrospirota bacterium]
MSLNSLELRVRSLELLRGSLLWQHNRHSRESGNPDAVPAKGGNYTKELDSCFHRKPWIPCQARNDKIGLHEFLLITLFFIIFFAATARAESLKVSLLLGDTHSRTAIEAIKAVRSQESGVKSQELENISFHVYPSKDIRNKDLRHLKESKL